MRGEVEFERRHRDEVALHRVKVGALAQFGRVAAKAQPVIRQAAPVRPLLDAEIVGELALAGDARALDLVGLAAREVQVEEGAYRQIDGEQLLEQRRRQRLGCLVGNDALLVLDE